MELENVLLIGGSGFVGGWIASCLSERGIRVTYRPAAAKTPKS